MNAPIALIMAVALVASPFPPRTSIVRVNNPTGAILGIIFTAEHATIIDALAEAPGLRHPEVPRCDAQPIVRTCRVVASAVTRIVVTWAPVAEARCGDALPTLTARDLDGRVLLHEVGMSCAYLPGVHAP